MSPDFLHIQQPEWMDDPNRPCAWGTPDAWFPGVGMRPGGLTHAQYAANLCDGCSVLEECRAYAVADPELDGIWGGLTPDQRRRARRLRVAA